MPDPITVPTTIRIRSRRPSTRASARSDKDAYVITSNRRSDLVWAAGPAAARDGALADDRVVVGELFAFADVASRANPDRLVHHLEPAVRRARVVDEPRDVAADLRVAAPVPVHAEHPDAALGEVPLLALLALVVAHQLTGVVDDPRVLRDPLGCEDAEAVNRRSPSDDLRQRRFAFHSGVIVATFRVVSGLNRTVIRLTA